VVRSQPDLLLQWDLMFCLECPQCLTGPEVWGYISTSESSRHNGLYEYYYYYYFKLYALNM